MNHELLEGDLTAENEPEQWVAEYDLDLFLVVEGSTDLAVNHIEQVHEDESVEAYGVENEPSGWLHVAVTALIHHNVKPIFLIKEDEDSEVGENDEDEELVGGLAEDELPHEWLDELGLAANSLGLGIGFVSGGVWLGSEGDGAKDVHDQVGPEELDDIERGSSEGSARQ